VLAYYHQRRRLTGENGAGMGVGFYDEIQRKWAYRGGQWCFYGYDFLKKPALMMTAS
jgi:hypothetical protein